MLQKSVNAFLFVVRALMYLKLPRYMRFNLNSSFRMSTKNIYTSVGNSTSFRDPNFITEQGTMSDGGTGGSVILCIDTFSWRCMQFGNPSNPTTNVLCSGYDSTGRNWNGSASINTGGSVGCQNAQYHVGECKQNLIRSIMRETGVDHVIEKKLQY